MKTYCTIYIILLVVGVGKLSSQTATQNYIQTKTYSNDTGTTYLEVIQYFDGLGRPMQIIQKGITPTKADLVTYQEYDSFGRDGRSWLPAIAAGNNGVYMTLANYKTKAMATYNNTTHHALADSVPYSLQVYEPSTLKRVREQYAPGAEWHKNNKSVKAEYLTNNSNNALLNCIQYMAGGSNQSPTLIKLNNYVSEKLYVTKTEDENGNVSYEFKDVLGQIVLTRQIEANIPHDTYYVYNDFGNLCYVLPPRIGEEGILQAKLNELGYQYKYDNRNRCIWKKLPGCEPIYYVYDNADQIIFTQDGEQRKKSEWTFTIPDALGRSVLTGICKNSLNYAANPLGTAVVKAERLSATNTYKGYGTPTGVTLTTPTILSVNYYDNYEFLGYNSVPNDANTQYVAESGYGICYGDHQAANKSKNKSLLTGTLTAQMNSTGGIEATYLYSVMYYDNRSKLVQAKSNNHLVGGFEKEYIAYNFTGQPTQRKHVHSATGKTTQTEVYANSYDHAGRLLKTTHQLNGGTVATLAENTYDELGRLKTNKKGGVASSQSTYAYNVRSWTKSITGSLFAQTLYYNDMYGGSKAQYNGNIGAMSWKVSGDASLLGYAFTYDNLSRLTAANYLINGSTNTNYKTAYSYDKHGNIKTLQRYGKTTASAYGLIDNLTMTFTGNQMTKADDAVANISLAESADFKDYSKVATEYTYNANGAMNKDLNKGISDIQYNSLNLPRMMDIKSPVAEARDEYIYSASGVKLKTVQKWNPSYSTSPVIGSAINTAALTQTKTTDYVGNIIYENNALKRILVDGGYIEGGVYHYYLNDHLGNNRVVVNSSGTVIQKNHYYPFGTAFAEGTTAEQGKQPYKYNGKELDQMHGLNLYDYSARYYESVVGRFTSVDPRAEKYYSISPYAYVGNNPLNAIDPTGEDSYLLIWFSADDETGHAGIAVDNYKRQEVRDNNGNIVKDDKGNVQYEMVKDGTMTYFDLWPNNPVGKTELQKDVIPDYSKGVKINSLSDLTGKDPTGTRSGNVSAEGRAADGIVKIATAFEQDSKIMGAASVTAKSGKKYNACDFNCSTYVESALKQTFPSLNANQDIKVPFYLRGLYSDSKTVAPNNLYNAVMKLPGATNIKGPRSVVAKPYLQYYGK